MNKVIRVLQVGMTENIGGMETYLMNQYRKLNRNKVHYDFVNITADCSMVFTEEILGNGDNTYKICRRSKNPLKHYYQWWKLLRQQKGNYDAIVLNACHLYYVFPLLIGNIMGIPIRIMHSHNSNDELKIDFFRKCIIWINKNIMFKTTTDLWACSETAGKWMFGKKTFKVIHNAIDTQKFVFNADIRKRVRHDLGLNDKFVLGHVGRFTFQKNHEFLLDIFKEIHEHNKNAVLMLVGKAAGADTKYLDAAKQKVQQLGLQNYVYFLGMRSDVNHLMQAMDCFVLPSRFEGLPLVAIEAQAAGLLCFFSDTVTKELAITNLAHFFSLNDPVEWVHALKKFSQFKRVNKSSDIIQAEYDINTEIDKIEDFYVKRCR